MTDEELDNYLDGLKNEGWKVELRESGVVRLDDSFSQRYPQIPEGYVKFLQRVGSCTNAGETVWFLCAMTPPALPLSIYRSRGKDKSATYERGLDRIRNKKLIIISIISFDLFHPS
jgi:hypothetical protein